MDDTQQSHASEAGATRKRRSSILKNQRPARTPFSELEFNVATPTDTAKSRRVSFSKRTGVAEFVTNEATTTWKNFYEEHNKSLEYSGNDSGANATRQPIGHLGKRIFEQQFEEVEAVDFITSLDNLAGRNVNTTNVNFTQQLASLECTDNIKPTAPQNNFELSTFTDHHSKLFSDDLAIPIMGEMSGRIDVNFSVVQSIDEKDDLDEIQRDIERQSNVVGPGFSEYIEVELNSTHAAIKTEESDMSITETIPSPKVNVSRMLSPPDKKSSLNWVNDNENKCLDDLDVKAKTVVYDGNTDMSITAALPSKISQESAKRRTIVFEDGLDDLSMTKSLPVKQMFHNKENKCDDDVKAKTLIFDDNADMSITAVLPGKITHGAENRRTMIFDDDLGNLSMTRALPTKIMYDDRENNRLVSDIKAKSLIFDKTTDMSMTDVLPGKINQEPERRGTNIFDDGDLSMTKPVPTELLLKHSEIIDKSNLNVVFDESNQKPKENTTEKRKTILFDDDLGDLSMTKLFPTKMLSVHSEIINKSSLNANFNKSGVQPKENTTEKRKTILFDDDLGNLSMTKPIPAMMVSAHSKIIKKSSLNENFNQSILQPTDNVTEKRKTILFEDDLGNLSMTKPIAAKLLSVHSEIIDRTYVHDNVNKSSANRDSTPENKENLFQTIVHDNEDKQDMSFTTTVEQPIHITTEKRKTILFDDDLGDLSMTKPIPAQLLSVNSEIIDKSNINDNFNKSSMQKSCIFQDVKCSITRQDNDNLADVSFSLVKQQTEENKTEKRKTIIFDSHLGNLSITKTIPAKILPVHSEMIKPTQELLKKNRNIRGDEKKRTVLLENDVCEISINKPIPTNIINIHNTGLNKTEGIDTKDTELVCLDFSKFKAQDVVVYQVVTNDTSKVQSVIGQSDSSMLQDKIEQGDVVASDMTSEMTSSSDIEKKDAYIKEVEATANENSVIEKLDSQESQKLHQKSEHIEEGKDISRNVSVDSVVRNVSTLKTNSSKKSILCDLLDMSDASMMGGYDTKDVCTEKNSSEKYETATSKVDAESAGSDMFYITKDTDGETQSTDTTENNKFLTFVESSDKQLSDESQRDSMPEMVDAVQSALSELKESNIQFDSFTNTHKMVSVGVETEDLIVSNTPNKSRDNMDISKHPKSFREADNTKELLDMLSDLSETRKSIANEEKVSPITVKGHIALENKEMYEPRRVSIATSRQSIALSREDLLNNISMAQAALQQSIDMEDSDIEEPTPAVAMSPPKKSVRVSSDSGVVKTLHFEDESSSEVSTRSDLRSPLKKTAFGETSYMKEVHKRNVIPSYLKDVSDGIKSLMHDLVKPMADEQPFESVPLGKVAKTCPSTCSIQIQANLCTSSQVDVTNELHSNQESLYDMDLEKISNRLLSPKSPGKSVSFIASDVYARSDLVSRNLKEASFRPKRHPPEQPVPGRVLLFDHENPLNNVLLMPNEFTEVHKYTPVGESSVNSNLSRSESDRSPSSGRGKDEYEVKNLSVRFNYVNYHTGCPSGDSGAENMSKSPSLTSTSSKPMSIDQSTGVKVTEVKDIEVNTAIAMKKNKELLEASSSLTLVDDALGHTAFDVDIDSPTTRSSVNLSEVNYKAPLRVIYTLKGDVKIGDRIESDLISSSNDENSKAKKRIYSPSSSEKYSSPSSNNVTPKPLTKMQRLSDSPNIRNFSLKRISGNKSLIPERDISSAESKMDVDASPSKESPKKRSPRKKISPKKGGLSVTVQQLITEFNVMPDIDQKVLNKQILKALSMTDSSAVPETISDGGISLDMVSSFTSSKNQSKAGQSRTTTDTDDSHFEEEKSVLSACASSVNVVAKIDMLSFMGSHECEWASSGTDSWSFRLLHGRLRLNIRLAHCHHNATRTRVRGDTPVTSVTVHQSHRGNDKKNSVAMSCITFAAEAIRACAEGSCERAGDVPALLRRGAGVAKMALRWGRAMHDARMQLAYKLSEDGKLVLNVANIPLRGVYQVTMRLKLMKQENALPWPKAADVQVVGVLDDLAMPADKLQHLLATVPENWGHVPNTVWKIFRYLKNKTPEQEAFGI